MPTSSNGIPGWTLTLAGILAAAGIIGVVGMTIAVANNDGTQDYRLDEVEGTVEKHESELRIQHDAILHIELDMSRIADAIETLAENK